MNIKTFKLSDLAPADYNPRTIKPKSLERLGNCQTKFGDISGIVFNARSKQLVCGHQRTKNIPPDSKITTKAATDSTGTIALGHIITPDGRAFNFRVVDWDDITEKAANVAANSEELQGDWEPEGMETIMGELKFELPEFDDMGFDDLADSSNFDLDIIHDENAAGSDFGDDKFTNKKIPIQVGKLFFLVDNDALYDFFYNEDNHTDDIKDKIESAIKEITA